MGMGRTGVTATFISGTGVCIDLADILCYKYTIDSINDYSLLFEIFPNVFRSNALTREARIKSISSSKRMFENILEWKGAS